MSEFTKNTAALNNLIQDTEALEECAATPSTMTNSKLSSKFVVQTEKSRDELQKKVDGYKKRILEKDPVTGNSRYGDNMKKKVKKLLDDFDMVSGKLDGLISGGLLEAFQKVEEEERLAEEARVAAEAEAEKERLEAKRKAEEEERLSSMTEAQRQKEKEDEEREKLRVAAEAARQVRLQQEEEEPWVASIEVSTASFLAQLSKLPPTVKPILLQLYSQIKSHPDNENFRRIKIDNEKFANDFGQHEGGKELFLAAGWKLQTIDEPAAKILALVEPNLEADMDGWMAWFDRIKEIVELLAV
ncbi:hypothetical protein TrRE_jg8447 [Triparma retinervis]|uniref:PUB domain-containing protein n=1 Tax=Triparma retinervis TaxID=2557542 RepID=A0A9W6Z244_9STRA|nr:hypothetical protein TrRE_jg8447 [Triparma retinervis]